MSNVGLVTEKSQHRRRRRASSQCQLEKRMGLDGLRTDRRYFPDHCRLRWSIQLLWRRPTCTCISSDDWNQITGSDTESHVKRGGRGRHTTTIAPKKYPTYLFFIQTAQTRMNSITTCEFNITLEVVIIHMVSETFKMGRGQYVHALTTNVETTSTACTDD